MKKQNSTKKKAYLRCVNQSQRVHCSTFCKHQLEHLNSTKLHITLRKEISNPTEKNIQTHKHKSQECKAYWCCTAQNRLVVALDERGVWRNAVLKHKFEGEKVVFFHCEHEIALARKRQLNELCVGFFCLRSNSRSWGGYFRSSTQK